MQYYVGVMNSSKKSGALPYQTIKSMIEAGFIKGAETKNVRPASLDLSVSSEIYEVEGIFQPRPNETVRDLIQHIKRRKTDLAEPLRRDQMYIIRLNEQLALPREVYGYSNPKSTSGRNDVHVRIIADGVPRYDSVTPAGYSGELWMSIMPKTFPIKMYEGNSLAQLRLFTADTRLNNLELEIALQKDQLLWHPHKKVPFTPADVHITDNDGSLILTADISGKHIGYEGIKTDEVLDLAKVDFYEPTKFFKPLKKEGDYLYLKKGEFYILSITQLVRVPPSLACEMVPMDEKSGEFRSHYAGFIDPGWGWGKNGEGYGRPLTLEVRPFEDIMVRDKQPIAKIKFERMTEDPDVAYDALDSNYVDQEGPRLSKYFKK